MNNIQNPNLIAFSESIEKYLKQDFQNIKESYFNDENNLPNIDKLLLDNKDNIPVIELTLNQKNSQEILDPETDNETLFNMESNLPDYKDTIEKEIDKENIFEKTNEELYGDDFKMKNDFDYEKFYKEPMNCKYDDKYDDKNMCIYGCKCDDKCKHGYDCKYDDDCKSIYSRKPCKGSDDIFEPVCCNAICNVPRMDMITMVAEGQGTIGNADAEADEGAEANVVKGFKCGKGCKCGKGGTGKENKIAFKFFIGKKHSKYVGNMCLVNYDEEMFLTSDKIECFHSPNHTKFVAIFHFEEGENMSREIAVYGTTQICSIPPTLFIYSAPHCGEDDEIAMGGSLTNGTITIATSEENNGMMMN